MRITEVELFTSNLAITKTFYQQVLRLPLVQETEERVSFAVGYSTLHFCYQPVVNGTYHFAMLLPQNSLGAAHEWVKSRIPILPFSDTEEIAQFSNWNAQAFYFHDAQENILELIVHHDLHNETDEPFSPQTILGICEIGITVDDVERECKNLHERGVPYFSKGPYGPQFAVMGEEDGLLIISAEGRGWVPTGQPATKEGLRVVVESNREKMTLQY